MTRLELDVMWSIATKKSIEDNQPYTRYEFAKMVAAMEREACAVIADSMDACQDGEIGKAIRARGEA